MLSFSILAIVHAIRKSNVAIRKASGQHNVKLHEIRFRSACLKLSLLLVCNVFTWLPFLIVSILLLSGISVHDRVVQWVIVLGIPLCSSSDPILYNIATLQSYTKKRWKVHDGSLSRTSSVFSRTSSVFSRTSSVFSRTGSVFNRMSSVFSRTRSVVRTSSVGRTSISDT